MENNRAEFDAQYTQQASFDERAGKKVSPFADSPYITYYEENGQPQPVKPENGKRERKVHNKPRRFLAAVLVVLLVVCSCGVTAIAMNCFWEEKYSLLRDVTNNKLQVLEEKLEAAADNRGSVSVPVTQDVLTPAQVYDKNVHAVVSIVSDVASGTGFIISEDGYVVSNYHVIEGASWLDVLMFNEQVYEAEVIGYDAANDVSLLKIEGADLPSVQFGHSDEIEVGDQVVAIGNALGELTATLTVGYISGKDRVVSTDGTAINMLQTDAAINSGNSGGPLFNMRGEVIGITTAKYSGASSSGASIEGIGFAIPSDDVFGMIEDLQEFGYVTGVYLGVMVRDVEAYVIQNYGFPAGAYVDEVVEGVSADRAGIQAKDIIVNIGGYNVSSVSELTRVLRKFEPGDTTTITVFRSGAEVNFKITFDEKPQEPEVQQPEQPVQPDDSAIPDDFAKWFEHFFGQGYESSCISIRND